MLASSLFSLLPLRFSEIPNARFWRVRDHYSLPNFQRLRFCLLTSTQSSSSRQGPLAPLGITRQLPGQLVPGKEIAQLKARGLVGVRSVNRVVLNARRPLLADGPILGVGGIGGA